MEEREICCCGARAWTLVIGWLGIVGNVLSLFTTGVSLEILAAIPSQFGYYSKAERDVYERALTAIMIIMAILIVLGIFMAVVLLRGTYKKNPYQINFWLIISKTCLVIYAVVSFAELFLIPLKQVFLAIISTCVVIVIECFCIWVVGIHKAEIEASSAVAVAYKV